ncbi:hypothetical protein EDD85DRAFT_788043 [Armillaria nabsnona]|nr:hypothetical protein EDD85DRAFT_788043 [Armillaria nabsnona]
MTAFCVVKSMGAPGFARLLDQISYGSALKQFGMVVKTTALVLFCIMQVSLIAGTMTPDNTSLMVHDGQATSRPLTPADSNWIWTGEEDSPSGSTPAGQVHSMHNDLYFYVFLKNNSSDDLHTLYVNSNEIGSGVSYTSTQVYTIGLKQKLKNDIAVNATNTGGPTGMIATVLIDYSDNSTETFVTDASWKTLQSVPPVRFTNPRLDDSS